MSLHAVSKTCRRKCRRLFDYIHGVLLELAKAAGNPVPAKDLYESVWGEPFDHSAANSVMVHVRRLREKLAEADPSEEVVATVWGVGYRIETGKGGR